MPDSQEQHAPKWTEIIPPRYIAGIVLAILGGLGTLKGLHDVDTRVTQTQEDYVSRSVFAAVVDSLKLRIATSERQCRAAHREAMRLRAHAPLTTAEQAEVNAMMGPPAPRKGTLLHSLFGWLTG